MSSIEDRLARDIAAITGGVIVTESDLRDAREAVDHRYDSRRQQGRRRIVIAAAAAAVLIPVAGFAAFQTLGSDDKSAPQPAEPGPTDAVDPNADFLTGDAPTAQLIDGLWRLDNGELLLLFGEDGTVRFDTHGTLFSDPVMAGTYEIDGDLITVTTTDDARSECTGPDLTMRASLPESGLMRFVRSDSSSSACSPVPPGRLALEQVLPTNNDLAELDFSTGPGWEPLSDKAVLYGVWMAEGGGHVLEIDPDGAYYVADETGGLVDGGQWSLRASDLTMTSSAAAGECSEGDRFVLGGVEQVNSSTTGLRGTVEQNTCGGAWTPRGWGLLPHQDS